MKKLFVVFGQIYTEPGAAYHFSAKFLSELERRISRKMIPSEKLLKKYPGVERLCFDINASTKLRNGKVRLGDFDIGRAEADFGLVLPYSASDRIWKRRSASGVKHLIDTIELFFKGFNLDVPETWDKAEILELFNHHFEDYVHNYDL